MADRRPAVVLMIRRPTSSSSRVASLDKRNTTAGQDSKQYGRWGQGQCVYVGADTKW
jgi:hypothetical protein